MTYFIKNRSFQFATALFLTIVFLATNSVAFADTAIFQNGLLPSTSYKGGSDAQIRLKSPNTFYSGYSSTVTTEGGSDQRSVLLRWDLSSIPPTSVIESAKVVLNIQYVTTQGFDIYKLNRNWIPDKTNWVQYNTSSKWLTAGAKASSDRDATVLGTVVAAKKGINKTSLNAAGVAAVQGWVNNPASNFGLIIANETGTQYTGFNSNKVSTTKYRPALEVTYTAPDGTTVATTTTETTTTPPPTTTTTPTETTTTVTSPVDSSPAVSECLNRTSGSSMTLTTEKVPFSTSLTSGVRVDARSASYSGSINLPLRLQGDSNACMSGGVIKGTFPLSTDWSTMHDTYATNISAPNFLLENLRVHNYGDCIAVWKTGTGFTVRGAYCSQMRDDFVSNDDGLTGTIEDSFFDGGYVFFSDRSWAAAQPDAVTTIKNNLVRLQKFEWTYKNDGKPGHGWFWKQDTAENAVKLRLHGNIFMAEAASIHSGHVLEPSSILSCKKADGSPDNTIVWLGSGVYPRPDELKTGCFTLTTDRAVWDKAVADWKTRHGATQTVGASIASSAVFMQTLSTGSSHVDVKKLQELLAEKGYYTGPVTGYFGQLTKAALGALQIKEGIVADENAPGYGILGPRTRAHLNSM